MDLLDRLFHRLMEAAVHQQGEAPGARLTIADIYQHLVPYRAVRGELGVHELAQYEHTLLRLLSGERGYLRVESPEVETELRRELASPNPILGIYRDYAGVAVELPGQPQLPQQPRAQVDVPEVGPAPADPGPEPLQVQLSPPAPTEMPPAPEPTACHRCHYPLPDDVEVRFCPSCGVDQREVPCAACGQALRAEWNFCVRCGTARA